MSVRRLRPLALMLSALVAVVAYAPQPASAHKVKRVKKQRRHITERARTQTGTRYTYGGDSPRSGFDCSGFTSWVFENHGGKLARTSRGQFRAASNDGNRRIWKRSRLKKGDLVFFKTTSARVGHAGIYLGRGKFVSATSSRGVRVDSVYDPYYWGKRWVGATRHRSTRHSS